jgi:hypothetical protein
MLSFGYLSYFTITYTILLYYLYYYTNANFSVRCEHCKNMMSTWDDLSTEYVKKNTQMNIAKVMISHITELITFIQDKR